MSWAVEEWKEGLSPRVLQKIHELESQVDKLKKERQQRQYQLETLEAALQKQKQKVMPLSMPNTVITAYFLVVVVREWASILLLFPD